MKQAYISLGGNLGSPIITVKKALSEISNIDGIYCFRKSRLYETDPISSIPQNPYINAVCSFKTALSSEELFKKMQEIEQILGKVPKKKEEPRVIDLDLLFFGQEERNSVDLILPHPGWDKRLFVLRPLLELEERIFLKKEGKIISVSIRKLVESLTPSTQVRALYV